MKLLKYTALTNYEECCVTAHVVRLTKGEYARDGCVIHLSTDEKVETRDSLRTMSTRLELLDDDPTAGAGAIR